MKEHFASIDELNLDGELIRQPKLVSKYADRLADAKRELDNAKDALEVIEAELSLKIRSKPHRYHIEKITEGVVSATILLQSTRREAAHRVIEAQHKVRIYESAVNSLEHKRSSLGRLVELKQMDYYSEPNTRSAEHRERIKQEAIRRTRKE